MRRKEGGKNPNVAKQIEANSTLTRDNREDVDASLSIIKRITHTHTHTQYEILQLTTAEISSLYHLNRLSNQICMHG